MWSRLQPYAAGNLGADIGSINVLPADISMQFKGHHLETIYKTGTGYEPIKPPGWQVADVNRLTASTV